MAKPEMWVLAGPNGAGKSTLAQTHFHKIVQRGTFLNADDIAGEVSPEHPGKAAGQAGRSLIAARNLALAEGRSFAIETTLASLTLLRAARTARAHGYSLGLIYLWIADPTLCIQRIAIRVACGGHYIPDDTVRRRYDKGLRLLPEFLAEADTAYIFSANELPRLIAEKASGSMTVHRVADWSRIIGHT